MVGRNGLVESAWCPISVRSRSPGDEDGAHQGIVSEVSLTNVFWRS